MQSGLLPKSGRLFPTLTEIVAFCRLADLSSASAPFHYRYARVWVDGQYGCRLQCCVLAVLSVASHVDGSDKRHGLDLPQQAVPKSMRTICTRYGSNRFTYHQGECSTSVIVQVLAWKYDEVEPSTAFWALPWPAVDDCMAALPSPTFSTVCAFASWFSCDADNKVEDARR